MIKPILTDKFILTLKSEQVHSLQDIPLPVIPDLLDTFQSLTNCAGLAAPQIGHKLNIIVVFVQNKIK